MNDADIMFLHATASFLLQGLVLSFFVEYIRGFADLGQYFDKQSLDE